MAKKKREKKVKAKKIKKAKAELLPSPTIAKPFIKCVKCGSDNWKTGKLTINGFVCTDCIFQARQERMAQLKEEQTTRAPRKSKGERELDKKAKQQLREEKKRLRG